jgi:hypothetical protein
MAKFSLCVLKITWRAACWFGAENETLVVVMDFAQEFIDSAACGVQCEMLMGFHAAKAFN